MRKTQGAGAATRVTALASTLIASIACAAPAPRCPEVSKAQAPASTAAPVEATARPLAPITFDYDHATPLDWRDDAPAEDRDGALLHAGSYASPRGGRVPALLVEPRDKGTARAGVVFLHWGEGERSELVPDAIALAARGVLSLLPTAPSARPASVASPDVVTDREQYLQTVIDVRRALDLLLARGDVDPKRLAFVGHSLGAHIGGILAAVDARPRAYVLVSGVSSYTDFMRTTGALHVAQARASTPKDSWDRYLASMAPLDARNFLPKAPPAAFLFQQGKDDVIVAPAEAEKYRALAPGDATLRYYDGGHEMADPRAALDRRAWLLAHLGAGPTAAYRIEERDLIAEGIAFDLTTRALFVGSEYKGQILRVDEAGHAKPFATGLLGVLGLRVDTQRRRLWAATNGEPGAATDAAKRGTSELVAMDLATGAVSRRIALHDGGKHLLNDLAIGDDGTAYVTDSEAGTVLRARPASKALEALAPPGTLAYPNGIAFARGALYVAGANGISRVSLHDGTFHAIAHAEGTDARGLDGMYGCGGDLVGVQGRTLSRVLRFALDDAGERITSATTLYVADASAPLMTTGALDGSALLVVANSDIDALGETGLAPGDRPRTTVLRIDDACPAAISPGKPR